MKIYLAYPISGVKMEEILSYYESMKKALSPYYEVLTPFLDEVRNSDKYRENFYMMPTATNHAIYERDKFLVQQADIVYANLVNATERVSIGAVMELAWGSLLGKHTIVAMHKENIHRHAFIMETADIVFDFHVDALQYLKVFGSR